MKSRMITEQEKQKLEEMTMRLDDYQNQSIKTVLPTIKDDPIYMTLGLCGESGEVAEKIKKSVRDGNLDIDNLKLEIGDCLWYISQLSSCFGFKLSDVAQSNLDKLNSRKKRNKLSGNGDER